MGTCRAAVGSPPPSAGWRRARRCWRRRWRRCSRCSPPTPRARRRAAPTRAPITTRSTHPRRRLHAARTTPCSSSPAVRSRTARCRRGRGSHAFGGALWRARAPSLADQMATDAEGATKLERIAVRGAHSKQDVGTGAAGRRQSQLRAMLALRCRSVLGTGAVRVGSERRSLQTRTSRHLVQGRIACARRLRRALRIRRAAAVRWPRPRYRDRVRPARRNPGRRRCSSPT